MVESTWAEPDACCSCEGQLPGIEEAYERILEDFCPHLDLENNVGALASQSPTEQPRIAHLLERALRESTDDTVGNIADARLEREE